MKKTLIAFSTAGLILSSTAMGTVFADGIEPESNKVEVESIADQLEQLEELTVIEENEGLEEKEQAEQKDSFQLQLTLDNVIERALEDDSNLLILGYQLDLIGVNERELGKDVDDVEDEIDEYRGIPGVRGPLYDQRDALLDAIEKLPYQEKQLILQQESAIEGIKLLVTSRYVDLLAKQEQLELSKQSMSWLQDDLRIVKLQHQVGLASLYDIRDLEREIENLDRTIEDNLTNYERELLKLLVDLNIPYTEDITLTDIEEEVEVALIEKPENIDELIEKTYRMQTAKERVELAELTLKQEWYNGLAKRKANQVAIEEAQINIDTEKKELTHSINTLYNNVESLYLSYQDKLREFSNLEEDQERLRLQYQVGMVSKYDYEKLDRSFIQAKLELELMEKNYFTLLTQIDALNRGFIN